MTFNTQYALLAQASALLSRISLDRYFYSTSFAVKRLLLVALVGGACSGALAAPDLVIQQALARDGFFGGGGHSALLFFGPPIGPPPSSGGLVSAEEAIRNIATIDGYAVALTKIKYNGVPVFWENDNWAETDEFLTEHYTVLKNLFDQAYRFGSVRSQSKFDWCQGLSLIQAKTNVITQFSDISSCIKGAAMEVRPLKSLRLESVWLSVSDVEQPWASGDKFLEGAFQLVCSPCLVDGSRPVPRMLIRVFFRANLGPHPRLLLLATPYIKK